MRRIVCWTIIFLMVAQPAWSANYFADDGGDGSDPASCVGCPCATAPATIQAMFDNNDLGPTDNPYVCGGTYNEAVTWGANDEGDATGQVTLKCYPGDTCTIDGQSARAQCIIFNSRDYITIDGFTVTGATASNISSTAATTGVIIKNITCPGGGDCLLSQAGSNAEYRGFDCTGQTSECLNIQTAASNVTIGDITSSSGNRVYIADITNLTIDDDITLSNGTNYNINFTNISGTFTITGDVTASNSTLGNMYLNNVSALVQVDGIVTLSGAAGGNNGLLINDSTLTAGSYFSHVVSSGNAGNGIDLDDTSNISFRYYELLNNTTNGARIRGTGLAAHSGIVFGGERISKICGNGQDGWSIFNNVTATIQNTEICSNGGGGIPTDEGDGITGHTGSTTYAYRNLIHDNDNTCAAYTTSSNLYGYNNTCYSNGLAGGPRGGLWLAATGTVAWKNNIMSENLPFELDLGVGLSGHTLDYNNYYHPVDGNFADTDGDRAANYASLALFTVATGQDANSIEADPIFINPSAGDFRLDNNSPAIRAGVGTYPNGKPCDIGAYKTTPGFMGRSFWFGNLSLGHAQSVCTIP